MMCVLSTHLQCLVKAGVPTRYLPPSPAHDTIPAPLCALRGLCSGEQEDLRANVFTPGREAEQQHLPRSEVQVQPQASEEEQSLALNFLLECTVFPKHLAVPPNSPPAPPQSSSERAREECEDKGPGMWLRGRLAA